MAQEFRKSLVGELGRDVLAVGGISILQHHSFKDNILPSGLLKLIANTIGDLLIGRTHLCGINLAAAELALNGVKG